MFAKDQERANEFLRRFNKADTKADEVDAGLLKKGRHKAKRIIDIESELDQVIAGQHNMAGSLVNGAQGG
jgi:hypothetical protein